MAAVAAADGRVGVVAVTTLGRGRPLLQASVVAGSAWPQSPSPSPSRRPPRGRSSRRCGASSSRSWGLLPSPGPPHPCRWRTTPPCGAFSPPRITAPSLPAPRSVRVFNAKNDGFCAKNDGFYAKTDGFCTQCAKWRRFPGALSSASIAYPGTAGPQSSARAPIVKFTGAGEIIRVGQSYTCEPRRRPPLITRAKSRGT